MDSLSPKDSEFHVFTFTVDNSPDHRSLWINTLSSRALLSSTLPPYCTL